jgi:hypothetical protein
MTHRNIPFDRLTYAVASVEAAALRAPRAKPSKAGQTAPPRRPSGREIELTAQDRWREAQQRRHTRQKPL